MNKTVSFTIVLTILVSPLAARGAGTWGRLANPGFEDQPIKSVFFRRQCAGRHAVLRVQAFLEHGALHDSSLGRTSPEMVSECGEPDIRD